MKQVTVRYRPQGEGTTEMEVPVRYRLEYENPNVTILHCEIDLPEADRPEWMRHGDWSVRSVYSEGTAGGPGVTVTELGAITGRNMEEHLFIAATHDAIESTDADYRERFGGH